MVQGRDAIFVRLRQSLHDASDHADIEAQARGVLALVVDPVVDGCESLDLTKVESDPSTCPNCGVRVASKRSPYCGEPCRETAGFVRQFRAGLDLGWIFEPEKQVALGQALWHVLGGGRPLRSHIAPARSRRVAIQREGERCQVCGAPAITVDHIGSGCNRPTNLRAVCDSCCQDIPFGDSRVLEESKVRDAISVLAARIGSAMPLRCCDDAASWDWRDYLRERQTRG